MVEVGERVARQRSPDIRKINPVIMERTDTFCARCLFLSSPVVLLPWFQGAKRPPCAPEGGVCPGDGGSAAAVPGAGQHWAGLQGEAAGTVLGDGNTDGGKGQLLIAGHIPPVCCFVLANLWVFALHLSQRDCVSTSPPELALGSACIEHSLRVLRVQPTQGWGRHQVMDPISCASNSSTA